MTLGDSFRYLGDIKIALDQFERAHTIYALLRGPNHPDTLRSMHELAGSCCATGRNAESLELFEKTLTLRKETLGPDHPDTLLTSTNLGCTYRGLGRCEEALKVHKEAQKLYEDTLCLLSSP
jgi:tetratricopeptide (TPR) repeat protein